jgi:hypothetical protein
VQGDDDVAVETTASSPAVRVRQRLKGHKAELSWLMRTTYISNDGDKLASSSCASHLHCLLFAVPGGSSRAHVMGKQMRCGWSWCHLLCIKQSFVLGATYLAAVAQTAKGMREKEAKVQRELQSGPAPPEDPVAHQIQEIEVRRTRAAVSRVPAAQAPSSLLAAAAVGRGCCMGAPPTPL